MSAHPRQLRSVLFETLEIRLTSSNKDHEPQSARLVYSRLTDEASQDTGIFRDELYRPNVDPIKGLSNLLPSRGPWWVDSSGNLEWNFDIAGEVMVSTSVNPTLRGQPARRPYSKQAHIQSTEATLAIKRFIDANVQLRWLPIERTVSVPERSDTRRLSSDPTSIDRKVEELQNQLVRYFSELDKRATSEFELFRNRSFLSLFNVDAPIAGSKAISIDRIERVDSELADLIPELKLEAQLEVKFRKNSENLLSSLRSRTKGRPLEALRQALGRLEEVLEAWRETQKTVGSLFERRDEFIKALTDAFALNDLQPEHSEKFGKKPVLQPNNEVVFRPTSGEGQVTKILDLSSGEKQFFIMLAEALLERDQETVLIVDEPELSLHITWQARLVRDLIRMNPHVQLVLATHSPDILQIKSSNTLHMEDIARRA